MVTTFARLTLLIWGISLTVAVVCAQPGRGPQGPQATPTVADFAYGGHERHVLDLYQSESSTPTPLVVYIHGGGFHRGDKKGIDQDTLKQLLDAGISVAAINYRFAHHDVERALQTLRSKAKEWNIDKDQVGAFGGSSGAQLCMWLAYHDDAADPSSSDPIARESTRLSFVAPLNGQTTNDLDWWLNNLPGYKKLHIDPADLYGTSDGAKQAAVINQISAWSNVSADDPPTFMTYGMAPGDPVPEGDRATAFQVHHVNFGMALKERLEAVGVEADLHYKGADSTYNSAADFFIRKFGKAEILRLSAEELADYHSKLVKLLEANPSQTGEVYRQGVSGGVGGRTPLPESKDRNHYLSILHRGGKMVEPIQAEGRPGEWRAPRIEGPRRVKAGKGDLINIPFKTAHQWDLAEGESVTYVILKIVERDEEIRDGS